MRAIAFAILIAGGGIEYVILQAHGKSREFPVASGILAIVFLVAFVVCVIAGI